MSGRQERSKPQADGDEGGEPRRAAPDDGVQEASEESFPASDAPSWEPLHPGTPSDHGEHSDQDSDD